MGFAWKRVQEQGEVTTYRDWAAAEEHAMHDPPTHRECNQLNKYVLELRPVVKLVGFIKPHFSPASGLS